MIIKSVKNLKFKDELGTYQHIGRKALETILRTGFCGEVDYIQPVA